MKTLDLDERLKRWDELRKISDSREHKSPHDIGGCFASYGARGCPCCDAYEDLSTDVGEMIDELRRLKSCYDHERAENQILIDDALRAAGIDMTDPIKRLHALIEKHRKERAVRATTADRVSQSLADGQLET